MNNYAGSLEKNKDLRRQQRVNTEFPVKISIGIQLTVQGKLKDISSTSAFIRISNNIFLKPNDEIGFAIQCSSDELIEGLAYVLRLVPGEGFVICFTKMNEASTASLKKFIQKSEASF